MTTEDRDRGRYLRDTAALAARATPTPPPSSAPPPPRAPRGLEGIASTDSSGYVDLHAIMATDPNWVDRELERAAGGPRSAPPSSIAPIALPVLTAHVGREPVAADPRARAAKWIFGGAVVACAAVIGGAVAMRSAGEHATTSAPRAAATLAAPPPAAVAPIAPAQPAAVLATTPATKVPDLAPSAAAPSAPATPSPAHGAGKRNLAAAAAPRRSPGPATAAATPAPPPAAPAPAPGNDPVLDAIKATMAKHKKK